MQIPLIIAYDPSASQEITAGSRELCRVAADAGNGTVIMAGLDADTLADLRAWLRARANPVALVTFEPAGEPMTSAPFAYLPDGRPDWGSMWTSFCELALYGGPPHRGEDNPVGEPETETTSGLSGELLSELQRGIFETTGLQSETTDGPWLAVRCHSRRMAAWMCAAIILENVDARCEGEVLLLPASEGFALTDQVKSLITVLAKVNHYWQAHLMGGEPVSRL